MTSKKMAIGLRCCYFKHLGWPARCVMTNPILTAVIGEYMDTRLSVRRIDHFVRANGIDLSDYEKADYRSFNDFFTRRVRAERRPIDREPAHLIAPCDSKLTAFPIGEDSRFRIKGVEYTLEELLRDKALADRFLGGTLLLFRLTVGDYHRYSYVDSGLIGPETHIDGVFHTVNPAAASRYPIYRENTREFALLESEHFGSLLQMEVGAAMVGRIVNEPGNRAVRRGEEKGRFEFGGSTVIVLLQKGAAVIDEDILRNTREDVETVVHLGEKIGHR